MLTVSSAAPSQTLPTALTRRASAQSSMISWRMLSTPPIRSSVSRADQHAAAGRRRDAPRRIGDVPRRVELEEEEHEGRDQQPLPRGAAMQFDHQRNEVVAAAFGARDERGQIVRRVHDIGVGQQQVIGVDGRAPLSMP